VVLGLCTCILGGGCMGWSAVSQLVRSDRLVGQVGPGPGLRGVRGSGWWGRGCLGGGGPALGASLGLWVCSECIMYAPVAGGNEGVL
jgi:hypothetical protein